MEDLIILSVHQIIDLVLREGDIDSRVFNIDSMQRGIQIHKNFQNKIGNQYLSEYPLKIFYNFENKVYQIQGRADGVIIDGNDVTIEEIKSTNIDLEIFYKNNKKWHLGQAMFYGFMYCYLNNLNDININLIYISQVDYKKTQNYNFSFNFLELKTFFEEALSSYVTYNNLVLSTHLNALNYCKTLSFPYFQYRKNQKEIINFVSNNIENNNNMIIEAPTGNGKTVVLLYSYLKNLEKFNKIFFLTAKEQGKEIAKNTLETLNGDVGNVKCVIITAKEKICLNDEVKCNPKKCIYARNYYNKILNILKDIILSKINILGKEEIIEIAQKNLICPFQLQYDIAKFSWVIVCDYNYVFDPFISLEENTDYENSALLIDEGHNLIKRVQDNYSSLISLNDLIDSKNIKKSDKKRVSNSLIKAVNKIISYYTTSFSEISSDYYEFEKTPSEIKKLFQNFVEKYEKLLDQDDELLNEQYFKELYMKIKAYIYCDSLLLKENFVIYYEKGNCSLNIYCLDPFSFIKEKMEQFKSISLFSATLTPIDFYNKYMFDSNAAFYCPERSFYNNQLNILVNTTNSILYKDRAKTLNDVTKLINCFCSYKKGNYLVYTPSFEYLDLIKNNFKDDNFDLLFQNKNMDFKSRDDFLEKINTINEKNVIGFCVLGGIFSESINIDNRVIRGIIVIGVGYPQINYKNEKLKQYYGDEGFKIAYLYPGMNNVIQAVGRLIRNESDYGCALLIDKRYNQQNYYSLFKNEWLPVKKITNIQTLLEQLSLFYEKINK